MCVHMCVVSIYMSCVYVCVHKYVICGDVVCIYAYLCGVCICGACVCVCVVLCTWHLHLHAGGHKGQRFLGILKPQLQVPVRHLM